MTKLGKELYEKICDPVEQSGYRTLHPDGEHYIKDIQNIIEKANVKQNGEIIADHEFITSIFVFVGIIKNYYYSIIIVNLLFHK